MQSAQRARHLVLVDFSSAWCVTCLVNQRLVLDDRAVVDRPQRAHVVTLKADWTNRDPAIAAERASHGLGGVPRYLRYLAVARKTPLILPQILTSTLVAALAAIAPSKN